jgi:hypothetical protein
MTTSFAEPSFMQPHAATSEREFVVACRDGPVPIDAASVLPPSG